MLMQWLLLLILIALIQFNLYKCDQAEYDLIHSILKYYDSSIRPSMNHNFTLNVTFGLALTQLIDVNWIDHKLKWDPAKYNFIKSVHLPADRIWKPDILLVNNADSWAKTSSISTNAIVKHNGNVTWLSTVIFKSSCSINVRYFPFDEQTCDLIFASWTFDSFFLDLNLNSGEGDLTNYIKNGEWHLVKLTAIKYLKNYSCCDYPYPEIYYKLVIRRRPLYYVFNLVFPCLLITLVAFLGFFLPPGSTEKVSIGITTLLSITVFLMLVAESMPPTSEQLPLLGIYYAVTIGIVSLSTATAVVTLNINNKGNKGAKVPRIVKIIFFNYLAKIIRIELKNKIHQNSKKSKTNETNLINTSKRKSESQTSSREDSQKSRSKSSNSHEMEKRHTPSKEQQSFRPLIDNSESRKEMLHNLYRSNNKNIRLSSDCIKQSDNNLFLESRDYKFETRNSLILKSVPMFKTYEPVKSNEDTPFYNQAQSTTTTTTCSQKVSPHFNYSSSQSKRSSPNDANERLITYDNDEQQKSKRKQNPKKPYLTTPYKIASTKHSTTSSLDFMIELEKILCKQFNPLILILIKTINNNEKKLQEKKRLETIQSEWSDVAMISDHILCYLFCLLTLVSCLLIFLNSPHFLSEW